jgi:serine/threonine protein kinase
MVDLVFGKYEIQHRLAIGGMGEVFYAVQTGIPGFERPVILKNLLPELAEREGFIDQFLDEARVAATLNHPNVVSIYEVGCWNDTYFIAMEYIRGRNLAQLLRKCVEQQQMMPIAIAGKIVADAALGLHHAHTAKDVSGQSLNIIHRDISPQNIMVRDDGVTKVVDFGIARASNRATRTETGTLKGKLAYLSPEQIAGSTTAAVDQYALGIVFWELLTARRLFKNDTDIKMLEAVLAQKIEAPSTQRADIEPELDALVLKMLHRVPEERFATCADAATAINELLGTKSGGTDSVASFMRRLGTEDLTIKMPSRGQKNFVIPLTGPGSRGLKADSSTLQFDILDTGQTELDAEKKKKKKWLLPVGLAALALVGAGAAFAFSNRPVEPKMLPPEVPLTAVVVPEKLEIKPASKPEIAAPPVVKKGKLVLHVSPAGSKVKLDGRPKEVSDFEAEFEVGTEHILAFEKEGFKPQEKVFQVESDKELNLDIVLEPKPKVVAAVPPNQQKKPGATEVAAPASGGIGFLRLDTTPASTSVYVDGELQGPTPIFKAKFLAGKHELKMEDAVSGMSAKQWVFIKADEVTKLKVNLK